MEKILFVAIDVDDKKYHGYAVGNDLPEGYEFQSKPNAHSLSEKLKKFVEDGFQIKICYESTYLGFSICRDLRQMGYHCDVVASALIPQLAASRVKTDRLDAKKLAHYYMKGLLTVVHVPDLEDEMDRAVLRTREFVKGQLQETKRYILSSCRKLGWNYRQEMELEKESYWTDAHKSWLVEKIKGAPQSVRFNLDLLIANMDMLEQRMEDYEQQIIQLAESEKYQKRVHALICYRGIDYLSAMTLVCEIGDIRRFSHPRYLVSYAGMDICEYSSGGKERRFKMTKMGNRHIRTTVIESNQNFGLTPRVSVHLKRRREKCEQQYIEIADRCMTRLYKKGTRLQHRTKVKNKIKVACGREMLGFIWESLMKAA